MLYIVTIASTDGNRNSYRCSGSNDQEALIYAGKVVEAKADRKDRKAVVTIMRNGNTIGPRTSVGEMLKDA